MSHFIRQLEKSWEKEARKRKNGTARAGKNQSLTTGNSEEIPESAVRVFQP